jgi:hypothetical protein
MTPVGTNFYKHPARGGRIEALTYVATAVAVFLANPKVSMAFEFGEHAMVTNQAISKRCATDSSARMDPVCIGARYIMNITNAAPRAPITIGIITALAGDHSVSPPELLWRFYTTVQSDHPLIPLTGHTIPEALLQSALPVDQIMSIASDSYYSLSDGLTADQWKACRGQRKSRWDNVLTNRDHDYLRYAMANQTHFRPSILAPAQLSDRYEYSLRRHPHVLLHKPARNAIAYYGDLHGGALMMARFAGLQSDDEQRTAALGTAVFLEAFALHYLQDSVAAGHILVRPLPNDIERGRYHNGRNDTGVEIDIPAMARALLGSDDHPTLLGDGSLWCRESGWKNGGITAAYADLLSATSLEELAKAYKDESLVMGWNPSAISSTNKLCDNQFMPDAFAPLQSTACKWWEGGPEVSIDQRRAQINDLFRVGYYQSFRMLPSLRTAGH